ncbi:MAG: hypothetical protein BWZ01_02542 [Deltaproteobacteria bacterium ADurb.BinA179]|nr:MAG: hypothetical protein BWZ01_02542 [Deltaproteobacteria bacterium ADurb.BinA179]
MRIKRLFPFHGGFENSDVRICVVRVHQRQPVEPGHILQTDSEKLSEGAVDEHYPSAGVHHPDNEGGAVRHDSESLLALAQLMLGVLAVRDVSGHAADADNVLRSIPDGELGGEEPVIAVRKPDYLLGLQGLSAREHLAVVRLHGAGYLGRPDIRCLPAQYLLNRDLGRLLRPAVQEGYAAFGIFEIHHRSHTLDEPLNQLAALQKFQLGLLALGDVHQVAGDLLHTAVSEHRPCDGPDPALFATGIREFQLQVIRLTLFDSSFKGLSDHRSMLGGVKRDVRIDIVIIIVLRNSIDPISLIGPGRFAGRHVNFPSACHRDFLGLSEQGLAFLQGVFDPLSFSDILDDPRYVRNLAPGIKPGLALYPDPSDVAVRVFDPALEIDHRTRRECGSEILLNLISVVRYHMVEQHSIGPAGGRLCVPEYEVVARQFPDGAGFRIQLPDAVFPGFQDEVQALFAFSGRALGDMSVGAVCHFQEYLSGLLSRTENMITTNYRLSIIQKDSCPRCPSFFLFLKPCGCDTERHH